MELSGVSVNTIPTFQLTAPRMKFPNTLHVAPTTRTVRYSIIIRPTLATPIRRGFRSHNNNIVMLFKLLLFIFYYSCTLWHLLLVYIALLICRSRDRGFVKLYKFIINNRSGWSLYLRIRYNAIVKVYVL